MWMETMTKVQVSPRGIRGILDLFLNLQGTNHPYTLFLSCRRKFHVLGIPRKYFVLRTACSPRQAATCLRSRSRPRLSLSAADFPSVLGSAGGTRFLCIVRRCNSCSRSISSGRILCIGKHLLRRFRSQLYSRGAGSEGTRHKRLRLKHFGMCQIRKGDTPAWRHSVFSPQMCP